MVIRPIYIRRCCSWIGKDNNNILIPLYTMFAGLIKMNVLDMNIITQWPLTDGKTIRVKDRRVPTNGHVCITNLTLVDNNVTTIGVIRTQLLYFCRINCHRDMGYRRFFCIHIFIRKRLNNKNDSLQNYIRYNILYNIGSRYNGNGTY